MQLTDFVKRALPAPIFNGLRAARGRFLVRGISGHQDFAQAEEDARASGDFSIVMPIHDAPVVTRRCLASLEKYAPQAEVILVDDASILPATLEAIDEFKARNGWKLIRHDVAKGHSAGCRDGAHFATKDFICFLNSDTVVTPWCWRLIQKEFHLDPAVGIAGPSTSASSNEQTLESVSKLGPYMSDNQICTFASGLLAESPLVTDLDWLSGFAFFVRRSLWEHVGGFDENLPDYGNEKELCWRLAKLGYRSVWVRQAYIHHFAKQSYSKTIGTGEIAARIRAAEVYMERKHGRR
jgi:GT2 family glycosyltransferase